MRAPVDSRRLQSLLPSVPKTMDGVLAFLQVLMRVLNEDRRAATESSIVTNQDIEITDATRGVVIKSPDGNRWRIVISNAGTITGTAL